MSLKATPGRNIAVAVKKIAASDSLCIEVEGGWVRRLANETGFLIEDAAGRTMFVAEKLLKAKKTKVHRHDYKNSHR